jgi:hypothetical protein
MTDAFEDRIVREYIAADREHMKVNSRDLNKL